jgi:hypothetical protein
MAKDGNPVFGVRVRQELQDQIKARAKVEGLAVAEWLERHLRPVLEADPLPSVEQRLTAVERRLDALEGSGGRRVAAASEPPPEPRQRLPQGNRSLGRSGPNRTPPETVARIMELSDQGWSGQQIANEIGITRAGANKILKRERERQGGLEI